MPETSKSLESFLNSRQPEAAPAAVETPVATENVSQPTETPTPGKPDEPTVVESWDKSEPPAEPTQPVTQDEPYHAKIAKKVGLELKDEDDLINRLKADPYEGVPTNLKKAIEFAKKGGDYLQLLKVSQVDYNSFDPVQLYEADVLSKATDKEAAKEYLQTISPIQKQIEGARLKQSLVYQQQAQEADLSRALEAAKNQAAAEKQRALVEAQKAIDSTDAIEVAGYKLKLDTKHKKALSTALSSQEYWKDPRYQTSKGYDINRKIRDEFLTANWDTVQSFLTDRVKTAALKEVANEVQNVQLDKPQDRDQVDHKPTPLFDQLNKWSRDRK